MTEFGPNGAVISTRSMPERNTSPQIKRIRLATFTCGFVAILAVAVVGYGLFLLLQFALPGGASNLGNSDTVLQGILFGTLISAMNWIGFVISLPIAWLGIGFSVGRLPRQGHMDHLPYYKTCAFAGALCTSLICGLFGLLSGIKAAFGALLSGAIIGGLAGLICAWLFLLIVRPEKQIVRINVDVF